MSTWFANLLCYSLVGADFSQWNLESGNENLLFELCLIWQETNNIFFRSDFTLIHRSCLSSYVTILRSRKKFSPSLLSFSFLNAGLDETKAFALPKLINTAILNLSTLALNLYIEGSKQRCQAKPSK
jgi:hypothetical protein